MTTERLRPDVDITGPVEIAPRVWWVGHLIPGDRFQAHAYLIEAGDQSVLIDPGSALTIDHVLAKVRQVLDPRDVRWVVAHHTDPDVCSALPVLDDLVHPDAHIVTEWRGQALLRHYGSRLPFYLVEDHDWRIDLGEERRLDFTLIPYLHFPGALASYETSSRVLFTCDLFGGFTVGDELVARDLGYFDEIRAFHEHYMPSGDILRAGLDNLRHRFPDTRVVAPQHGRIFADDLVWPMFDRLSDVECGIFLMAQDDLHLANLLAASALERRLAQTLLGSAELPDLADRSTTLLREFLPVERLEAYVATEDEGTLLFSPEEGYSGTPVPAIPYGPTVPYLALPQPEGAPSIRVYAVLPDGVEIPRSLARAMIQLAQPIQIAMSEHLARRAAARERQRIIAETLRDPLTGLHNRRVLSDAHVAEDPSAILMIDLDNLKDVNDAAGHDAGDQVLRGVARVILGNIRQRSDLGVRYGGDEFLVVLREAGQSHAIEVAERIRQQVEHLRVTTIPDGASPLRTSVSIGVAMHPSREDLGMTILRADRRLYEAKSTGRNRVITPGD